MTVRLPDAWCPECGARLTAASPLSDLNARVRPVPGQITICTFCGKILVFNAKLQLRFTNAETFQGAPPGFEAKVKALAKRIKEGRAEFEALKSNKRNSG